MTGINYVGSFASVADRLRLDLRARQQLKTRVRLLRILTDGRWDYSREVISTWPLRTWGGA